MKKILVTAMCAAAFGLAARADGTDVLMWYLDLSQSPDATTQADTTFGSINFYMVKSDDKSRTPVVSLNQKTYADMGNLQDGKNGGNLSSGIEANGYRAGLYYTDLRDIDPSYLQGGYEFMMTLYSGGDLKAWTAWLYNDNLAADDPMRATLSKIQQSSGLYSLGELTSDLAPSVAGAYNFGQNVVPEPTGGLLMLVGASLLALRRRRRA